MSSIPSITEWIEAALTTVAVCPDLQDNVCEELEDWLAKASGVQVRSNASVVLQQWRMLMWGL
jgi:hypothetical protein